MPPVMTEEEKKKLDETNFSQLDWDDCYEPNIDLLTFPLAQWVKKANYEIDAFDKYSDELTIENAELRNENNRLKMKSDGVNAEVAHIHIIKSQKNHQISVLQQSLRETLKKLEVKEELTGKFKDKVNELKNRSKNDEEQIKKLKEELEGYRKEFDKKEQELRLSLEQEFEQSKQKWLKKQENCFEAMKVDLDLGKNLIQMLSNEIFSLKRQSEASERYLQSRLTTNQQMEHLKKMQAIKEENKILQDERKKDAKEHKHQIAYQRKQQQKRMAVVMNETKEQHDEILKHLRDSLDILQKELFEMEEKNEYSEGVRSKWKELYSALEQHVLQSTNFYNKQLSALHDECEQPECSVQNFVDRPVPTLVQYHNVLHVYTNEQLMQILADRVGRPIIVNTLPDSQLQQQGACGYTSQIPPSTHYTTPPNITGIGAVVYNQTPQSSMKSVDPAIQGIGPTTRDAKTPDSGFYSFPYQ